MSEQLSLTGFDAPAQPTDRLFFAILPPPDVAERIDHLAAQLRQQHGLQGPPHKVGRFHITLHHLGDYAGLPPDVIAAASRAAESVVWPPFDLTFDRAMSFSGHRSSRPFVLRGSDEGLKTLVQFQQALGLAMTKAGIGRLVDTRFTPHVTLLYDRSLVADEAIEPIRWTADQFVLVHSLLGQTRHIHLSNWTLR
ncbi:MAG: 2'-5' RNA ligase [Rubrivivax sp.]|nr:MAG: 2'-5' RNA ligase [Rubrivivax sp.]